MKVLFIVPYVPGPVRVRPYNLIRSLARRGHQVTLATLVSTEAEALDLEYMKSFCQATIGVRLSKTTSAWNSAQAFLSGMPLQANWCWQPQLAAKITQMLSREWGKDPFDVVHVEHLRGARYGLLVRSIEEYGSRPIPIIWDSVDSISLLFRQASRLSRARLMRWTTQLELGRTEKYEHWLTTQFKTVLVSSAVDREALLAGSNHSASVEVLANGVDLDHFCPGNGSRDLNALVLSGKMSYHANITMALYLYREIMPKVWNSKPGVRVIIAGKDPPREILALSQNPLVSVTGTVEDITPFLQKSTLAVTPIQYGAGIQNKVLEAMATATPVVTTPQGVSAINAKAGQEVLVAVGADDFAQKVLYLLDHPEEQRRIGEAGYHYVSTNHRWDHIAAQLEKIYQDAIYSLR